MVFKKLAVCFNNCFIYDLRLIQNEVMEFRNRFIHFKDRIEAQSKALRRMAEYKIDRWLPVIFRSIGNPNAHRESISFIDWNLFVVKNFFRKIPTPLRH